MKFGAILSIVLLSTQSHALVTQGRLPGDCRNPAVCTVLTTMSLPTLIVQDTTGEEVWNSSNEELLAQYESELSGFSEIYAVKRYADIRTKGDVEAAKIEIRRNLDLLAQQK